MITNHNYYIDLAFQIAEKNLGRTRLNPSVGTVVVKKNTVISSAVTSFNGRPHSEFNALNNLKNCTGASLYTTLEPCTHYGETPPCVNIIIKKKIKKVFYAFADPDIRTFKKAKKILKLSLEFEKNNDLNKTIASAKPPIFWKDKEIVKTQLNKWQSDKIKKLIYQLNDTELQIKKNFNNPILITTNFILEQSFSELNN